MEIASIHIWATGSLQMERQMMHIGLESLQGFLRDGVTKRYELR